MPMLFMCHFKGAACTSLPLDAINYGFGCEAVLAGCIAVGIKLLHWAAVCSALTLCTRRKGISKDEPDENTACPAGSWRTRGGLVDRQYGYRGSIVLGRSSSLILIHRG